MIRAPAPESIERLRRNCEALTGTAPDSLAIAVSGGPDSLALLLLAAAAFPGRVRAATVDHGLRPESAGEARFVAGICATLGVPHALLSVIVDPARSSRQRAAREARYAALAGWCEAESLAWLATAHHADDQAETLLMRLLRGSGIGGLAGIRPETALTGSSARLIRPLLGWRHAELVELVAAAGLIAIADPSNDDENYDRARIRRRLAETGWLDPVALARSAGALGEAEQALAWAAERAWKDRVVVDGETISLDPEGLPAELVRRLLVRILAAGAPRGEEVRRLAARLGRGETATLAGRQCRGGRTWRFEPEPQRRQRGPTTM